MSDPEYKPYPLVRLPGNSCVAMLPPGGATEWCSLH